MINLQETIIKFELNIAELTETLRKAGEELRKIQYTIAPQTYKNMNLVKCYKNFALYENKYYKECFTYHELGHRTAQIIDKNIKVSNHF